MNREIPLLLLALCSTSAEARDWPADYDQALASLEAGAFEAAASTLDRLAAGHPEPALAGDGQRYDYLPHLNLAAARYELGEHAAARAALKRSAEYGVARQSYVGRALWDRYALRILARQSDPEGEPGAGGASFREFDRQEFSLAEPEAEQIRNQVLRRCALTGKGPGDRLPWYFHYEFGLELLEAGDAQRAVDELILAANKREDSMRNSRMYGMWFTNYLPYYRIALAHSQLGNWRCAMDAMRLSALHGEFSPSDRGFQDYSDLQKLILREQEASGG